MRVERMVAVPVDLAPPILEAGKLYVSQKYRAAVHTCCCGCGAKVVTPLSSAEWRVEEGARGVSVTPSIGNSRPCRSHYWIRDGRVVWHRAMSDAHVKGVFNADARSLALMHKKRWVQPAEAKPAPWIERLLRWLLG
jgi:hypothetical protein